MYNSKVMISPFKSTAHFPTETRFECQIAELTYPDDLHKILQLLFLKVSSDLKLFPACVFPPQYYSSGDIMWIFLVTFCRQWEAEHRTSTAAHPQLQHMRWHMEVRGGTSGDLHRKPFLLANSFAHQKCILVPSHYIPK